MSTADQNQQLTDAAVKATTCVICGDRVIHNMTGNPYHDGPELHDHFAVAVTAAGQGLRSPGQNTSASITTHSTAPTSQPSGVVDAFSAQITSTSEHTEEAWARAMAAPWVEQS